MGHQYGRSQAAVLIDAGDYEEAVAAATAAMGGEPENSEHYFERAQALDGATRVLDDDMLDDGYFSALLGAARAEEVSAGCARLARYGTRFPGGRHVSDAADWQKRLRGELPSHFVKER